MTLQPRGSRAQKLRKALKHHCWFSLVLSVCWVLFLKSMATAHYRYSVQCASIKGGGLQNSSKNKEQQLVMGMMGPPSVLIRALPTTCWDSLHTHRSCCSCFRFSTSFSLCSDGDEWGGKGWRAVLPCVLFLGVVLAQECQCQWEHTWE